MTEQQWYVHILGPDDVAGPFTIAEAFRYAAEVNKSMADRINTLTEDSFAVWAAPTRSAYGTTDYTPERAS
ncbi:hypothetical protein [Curtobacterium sp. USHLN213]|uniref:hypothetical protein n=1 Tax=Curtobacterium sp. USHLN213 TaxID=3081255 RepID=UPI00301AE6AE